MARTREVDLYEPIRLHLEDQGYTVRGEVKDCDVVAVRDEEMIVIELKQRFCVDLLLQATQRQRSADSVYVAMPRTAVPKSRGRWRHICHMLRRLELGLILVKSRGPDPRVVVEFHPEPLERRRSHKKRRAILREAANREVEFNQGGASSKDRTVTAYRENAILIACALAQTGPTSPKRLREMGTGKKTGPILNSNFYKWFQRVEKGVYDLTATGRAALGDYPEVVERCRQKLSEAG